MSGAVCFKQDSPSQPGDDSYFDFGGPSCVLAGYQKSIDELSSLNIWAGPIVLSTSANDQPRQTSKHPQETIWKEWRNLIAHMLLHVERSANTFSFASAEKNWFRLCMLDPWEIILHTPPCRRIHSMVRNKGKTLERVWLTQPGYTLEYHKPCVTQISSYLQKTSHLLAIALLGIGTNQNCMVKCIYESISQCLHAQIRVNICQTNTAREFS